MISIITTFFAWALKNQFIAGGLTLIGGKIYNLAEEWIKRKYFPKTKEVVVETKIVKGEEKTEKKKVVPKKRVEFAKLLLVALFVCMFSYCFITYSSFKYMKNDAMILEAMAEMKLVFVLTLAFLLAKLVSFTSTLDELGKLLPFIKNFIKK